MIREKFEITKTGKGKKGKYKPKGKYNNLKTSLQDTWGAYHAEKKKEKESTLSTGTPAESQALQRGPTEGTPTEEPPQPDHRNFYHPSRCLNKFNPCMLIIIKIYKITAGQSIYFFGSAGSRSRVLQHVSMSKSDDHPSCIHV